MNTENTQATLFRKIAAVMGAVRTLEKTGENKFDRYFYVTSDAIAIRIGKLMAEYGLAFLPSLVSVETSEYTTQKGGSNFRTVTHFQMTLACTETGATWTSLWSGEAIDRSDKSISKAAVSAVKYFLLKTFLLAGGDEEDADESSPIVEAKPAAQNRSQPSQTAQEPQNGSHAPDVRYAALIDSLTGDCLARANRARLIHAQSNGPASLEQYRFLAGTIDKLAKQDGAHRAILEVFVGRAVSSDNPPGAQLAGKLLDALLEERTVEVDGEKVKEPNPAYNPDAVACIHAVWRLVRELEGQTSLFEQPVAA